MAKKKGSKSGGRVVSTDASYLSLPLHVRQDALRELAFRMEMSELARRRGEMDLEDRRRFNPTKSIAPPKSIQKPNQPLAHRLVDTAITIRRRRRRFHARIAEYTDPSYTVRRRIKSRIGFSIPRRLEVCIRRQIRKEVLFARKKTGAGHPKQRKPVRNIWSAISCRRK